MQKEPKGNNNNNKPTKPTNQNKSNEEVSRKTAEL